MSYKLSEEKMNLRVHVKRRNSVNSVCKHVGAMINYGVIQLTVKFK